MVSVGLGLSQGEAVEHKIQKNGLSNMYRDNIIWSCVFKIDK